MINSNERDDSKLYRKGNEVSISNKSYATLYNRFLRRIESSLRIYDIEEAIQHDSIKGPRPVVIIWSHQHSDFMLALPMTTSDSDFVKKYCYKMSDNRYIKYEVLKLDKRRTPLVNKHVWGHVTANEIKEIKREWKKSHFNKSYFYLEMQINKLSNNAKDRMIEEMLREKFNKDE